MDLVYFSLSLYPPIYDDAYLFYSFFLCWPTTGAVVLAFTSFNRALPPLRYHPSPYIEQHLEFHVFAPIMRMPSPPRLPCHALSGLSSAHTIAIHIRALAFLSLLSSALRCSVLLLPSCGTQMTKEELDQKVYKDEHCVRACRAEVRSCKLVKRVHVLSPSQ